MMGTPPTASDADRPPLDFGRFRWITFDCYGTLVDWERGILETLVPLVSRHGVQADPGVLLRLFARLEAREEAGEYRPYREVLRSVVRGLGEELGFTPSADDMDALPDSVGGWPPFPDTSDALRRLGERYRLGVVSNVDEAMFRETRRALAVSFDEVVTAEQVRSYKPSLRPFEVALERMGAGPGEVLHVAQSLYHDHVPARTLGLRTVWVNRPSLVPGSGATPPADASPDLEVPDLRTLAELVVP